MEGRLQLQKGDAVAAEKAFRQAVELDPKGVEIRFQLGRALALQRRHADAAGVFREVLAIERGYGPAWLELGRSLSTFNPAAAVAALESAVASMPASEEARAELARAKAEGEASPQPPP